MPPPEGNIPCYDLIELCLTYSELAADLQHYVCAGHLDTHGVPNHLGVHAVVKGPNVIGLGDRACLCLFFDWCDTPLLEEHYSLRSHQMKHVFTCV
jgi:hypothetical protein